MREQVLYGSAGGQHVLGGLIDHGETYGPHVIESLVSSLSSPDTIVDIGAGSGRDLGIVGKLHPRAKLIALEAGPSSHLSGKANEIHVVNIERDRFPLDNDSTDLIMANQVLEHTKEIFWIFHEVSRSLKVGGHFLFGVPNLCSLHNRLLLPLGKHPTQHKLCSAHVRPFSKRDTLKFLEACFPGGYSLQAFRGSQFYPFPAGISRVLSGMFPTLAFSIFFMIQKQREYNGEFARYPEMAKLESNFWVGDGVTTSYL